ncbi:MAG: AMP-binding protein [Alphaproteobacteria bacterium]|nr:AMP-binding protein [Alphaproteobacteria bacterium]
MTRNNAWVPTGKSAHVDTFTIDNLPPKDLWPRLDFSQLPQLREYPGQINAANGLLDDHVSAGRGDRTAILFGDLRWTYADLKSHADRIARVLVEDAGLVPGNRVLLRGPNNPMMAAAWFAVIKAGGVCVATMPLLRARELTHIIDKAQITHALCDEILAEAMAEARTRTSSLTSIMHFSAAGDGGADLDSAIAARPDGFDNVDTAADDPALIAFTSGTTGAPKGTIHFHRDVLAMCDCFPTAPFGVHEDDIFTGTPPLAFTFGLGAMLGFPLRAGASVALIDRPSPEALFETIRRHRCTALFTAPVMFRTLTERVGEGDLSSLTHAVSAGEHLPKPIFEMFEKATGLRIIDGLGSTEMIHIFVSTAGDDIRPGATGKAIPGYEACILDDDGNPLPPGQQGHLAVRGPTGCRYLDDVERQRSYVTGDGWNRPGDIYEMDEDGYFWYGARADDMIISAGYNIAGPEVEVALLDHPKVRECAVVGVPDAERGNIVKAFVVLTDPEDASDATVKALQDFVKGEIAPYKYPRAIEFVDALPRTETGKVQRFKLREDR